MRKRRSSDSAAQRYWVGFRPIAAKLAQELLPERGPSRVRFTLRPDGFAEIRVPDLRSVMERVVKHDMDMNDILYRSGAGPVSVQDVIYGLGREIEESGNDFYAHKTGYSPNTLGKALNDAGFGGVFVFAAPEAFETRALAFKSPPTPTQQRLLNLPRQNG